MGPPRSREVGPVTQQIRDVNHKDLSMKPGDIVAPRADHFEIFDVPFSRFELAASTVHAVKSTDLCLLVTLVGHDALVISGGALGWCRTADIVSVV